MQSRNRKAPAHSSLSLIADGWREILSDPTTPQQSRELRDLWDGATHNTCAQGANCVDMAL